jgi:hypothetical protein
MQGYEQQPVAQQKAATHNCAELQHDASACTVLHKIVAQRECVTYAVHAEPISAAVLGLHTRHAGCCLVKLLLMTRTQCLQSCCMHRLKQRGPEITCWSVSPAPAMHEPALASHHLPWVADAEAVKAQHFLQGVSVQDASSRQVHARLVREQAGRGHAVQGGAAAAAADKEGAAATAASEASRC